MKYKANAPTVSELMTSLSADVTAHIEDTVKTLQHHVTDGYDGLRQTFLANGPTYFRIGLDIANYPDSIQIILEETEAGTVTFKSVIWFETFIERQIEAKGITHKHAKELAIKELAYYVENLPTDLWYRRNVWHVKTLKEQGYMPI